MPTTHRPCLPVGTRSARRRGLATPQHAASRQSRRQHKERTSTMVTKKPENLPFAPDCLLSRPSMSAGRDARRPGTTAPPASSSARPCA